MGGGERRRPVQAVLGRGGKIGQGQNVLDAHGNSSRADGRDASASSSASSTSRAAERHLWHRARAARACCLPGRGCARRGLDDVCERRAAGPGICGRGDGLRHPGPTRKDLGVE
jgi:hypothetical protein